MSIFSWNTEPSPCRNMSPVLNLHFSYRNQNANFDKPTNHLVKPQDVLTPGQAVILKPGFGTEFYKDF